MYVKLVSSGAIPAIGAMRDIGRLITSASPNVASLGAFSTTSSIVIDSTPAGWTYVGSNNSLDQPNIANTAASTAQPIQSTYYNLCFSSPTLANNSVLKYCALEVSLASNTSTTTTAGSGFNLFGASGATSLGVITNGGARSGFTASSAYFVDRILPTSLATTYHLIANPQHITIVYEGNGLVGVWESSQTDAHTFYNSAPMVQYSHIRSNNYTWSANTGFSNANASGNPIGARGGTFNITDPNTGTNYGTYDITEGGTINTLSYYQPMTGLRTNSSSASGLPTYQITPVYYSASTKGYPTQFVTGVVPIYWCNAGLGNSGDTVTVGADTYYYFNSGTGFGVLMKTS